MPHPRSADSPGRSALAERHFPLEAASRAEADWYAFVLEELNGLGTVLRFQIAEQGPGPPVDLTKRRIRTLLETVAWDVPAALRQTWAFVENQLHDFDEAWGPFVVLVAIERERKRVEEWVARLQPEARAIIQSTPAV